jgi:hypothetical protein
LSGNATRAAKARGKDPRRPANLSEEEEQAAGQTSRSTAGWIAALTVTEIVKEVKQATAFTLPPY